MLATEDAAKLFTATCSIYVYRREMNNTVTHFTLATEFLDINSTIAVCSTSLQSESQQNTNEE
jgi:hypothetical protein